jgi:hypothetical protein
MRRVAVIPVSIRVLRLGTIRYREGGKADECGDDGMSNDAHDFISRSRQLLNPAFDAARRP